MISKWLVKVDVLRSVPRIIFKSLSWCFLGVWEKPRTTRQTSLSGDRVLISGPSKCYTLLDIR